MDSIDRMTERSKKVLSLSETAARRRGHTVMGLEDVLIGLIEEGNGVAAHVLKWLGASVDRIAVILPSSSAGPLAQTASVERPPEVDQLLDRAYGEARALNHNYVGTEHLILAMASANDSRIDAILAALSLTPQRIRKEVYSVLGHEFR